MTVTAVFFLYLMCGPAGSVGGHPYYGATAERPCVTYDRSDLCVADAAAQGGVCILKEPAAVEVR